MSKNITFRNILETESVFKLTEEYYLVPAVYEYARNCNDDELYDIIVTEKICLYVNNECIHPDDWAFYKLKEDDTIIITPLAEKGKWGAVLMIVIGAALMYFAPGISLALQGTWLAVSAPTIALLGLSLALGGISSLLFRPDLPSMPGINDRQTQTYNWSGIKTMARTDAPIPIVYGTHKIGGNLISAFTEIRGNDNYLYMLIALSEGSIEGICTYDDHSVVCTQTSSSHADYRPPAIELDDQPLHYYDNVAWTWRRGANTQSLIPWFNAARAQYDVGREVRTTSIYPDYTTTKDVDAVTMHLYVPTLYNSITNPGKVEEESVKYKIQYRKTGVSAWSDYLPYVYLSPVITGRNSANQVITSPDSRILVTFAYTGKLVDEISATTRNISVKLVNITPNDNYYIHPLYSLKHWTLTIQATDNTNNVTQMFNTVVTGKKDYIPGSLDADRYGFGPIYFVAQSFTFRNFTIAVNEQAKIGDTYNITVAIQEGTSPEIEIVGRTKTGLWRSYDLEFSEYASYDLRILRTDGGKSDQIGVENNLMFQSVIEIVSGEFTYPNTALLGLRIKATDQLSGSIPNITTVIKGVRISVPDTRDSGSAQVNFSDAYWDVDEEKWEKIDETALTWNNSTYVTRYSNNSMLCVRDLLLNTRYGIGDYIESSDLYSAGIIAVIKDCHKYWQPTAEDYLRWWNGSSDVYFSNNITITSYGGTATIDNSNRKITLESSNINFTFNIDLNLSSYLTRRETYKTTVTIANSTENIELKQYVISSLGTSGLGVDATVGDGSHDIEFTANRNDINKYRITITNTSNRKTASAFSIEVTQAAIERLEGSKLHYHTFNGVIESGQAALAALMEMCDSFRTWPVWYNGKFNFVMNKDETPVHTLAKSNTESFSQTFTSLSEIPKRLIGQYVDEADNYNMTSLIAVSNDTSLTKTNERTIGIKGLTNRKRSERELKFKLNQITNCTHVVNVKAGLDSIHATAGDIITVQDDLPQWGYGGRVLSYNATELEISVSEFIKLTNVAAANIIKYQIEDNSFVTASINTGGLSNDDEIKLVKISSWQSDYPKKDAVYVAGRSTNYSKTFRIVSANRTTDDMIEVAGIEHLSELYTTEPTIRIIEDKKSELPNVLARPSPPESVSVEPLPKEEGIGFILNARAPADGTGIIEIIVKIKKKEESFDSFEIAAIIPASIGYARYINNNLEMNTEYMLSFECRNPTKTSAPVYVVATLQEELYRLNPPSGIRLKNFDQNAQTFKGRDITIEWNPVVGAFDYVIEIYHTSVASGNILRTAFVRSETYTYNYENMIDDGRGTIYGTELRKIIFRISSRYISGIQSNFSPQFSVYNLVPADVTGLIGIPQVGAVKFQWEKSNESDHRSYVYNVKVGSNSWSNTASLTDNAYIRTLTATEIDNYGNKANIYFRVKDRDWFNQVSQNYAQTSASANIISDNIFQMFITSSDGVGTLASLIDCIYDTGGIRIV